MRIFCLLFVSFLYSYPAQAFYSFHDSGDMLEKDQYEFAMAGQALGGGEGVNVTAFLDWGYTDSGNLRAFFGSGFTEVHTGLYYKWVPYPDYKKQPAIGLLGGAYYAQADTESEFGLRVYPFVSKKFVQDFADFNTYASLPISMSIGQNKTSVPLQLILGSFMKTNHYKNLEYSLEVGINIDQAFSFVSLGLTYHIDNQDKHL